jgi:hypothetical protein
MTTPILPTALTLNNNATTPAQAVLDAALENFLINSNEFDFLEQLFTAFRGGGTSTYNINGTDVTTPSATSFIYIKDLTTLNILIPYLVSYGYSISLSAPPPASIQWVPSTGLGSNTITATTNGTTVNLGTVASYPQGTPITTGASISSSGGLTASYTYYVAGTTYQSGTVTLANSYTNAMAGTAVTFTAATYSSNNSVTTGLTPYEITSGVNSGKYYMLVSWA